MLTSFEAAAALSFRRLDSDLLPALKCPLHSHLHLQRMSPASRWGEGKLTLASCKGVGDNLRCSQGFVCIMWETRG